jgi:isocitrate dehydrogenase (NAD+)
MYRPIVVIPGDGIGPEIVGAAMHVVEATGAPVDWVEAVAGEAALERYGTGAPAAMLESIRVVGAALKGPFTTPSSGTRRSPNQAIRRDLDLFACLRPIEDRARAIDILLVRENVEDLYAAVEWEASPGVAHAVKVATRAGCRRIANFAFELATRRGRGRVTAVHKANNLKITEGMFLDEFNATARRFPGLAVEDLLADTAASTLVLEPQRLDVLVTSNTFGDLLSNVGAAVIGSLGLVPSLNFAPNGVIVAEPSHGSAPELAGTGRANPMASIAAAGMLLQELEHTAEGEAILAAVRDLRASGVTTPDLGGKLSTSEVAEEAARFVAHETHDGAVV